MSFVRSLLSGDESGVDSVVVAGFAVLFVLLGCTIYALIHAPETWNPITFGTGAATVIGAAAAGKTGRDRFSTAPSKALPDNPQ